jgi:hypothetical protein
VHRQNPIACNRQARFGNSVWSLNIFICDDIFLANARKFNSNR